MTDTRLLLVQSEEPLGQFVDVSVEQFLGGDQFDISVTEVDPNSDIWEREIKRLI